MEPLLEPARYSEREKDDAFVILTKKQKQAYLDMWLGQLLEVNKQLTTIVEDWKIP